MELANEDNSLVIFVLGLLVLVVDNKELVETTDSVEVGRGVMLLVMGGINVSGGILLEMLLRELVLVAVVVVAAVVTEVRT